MSRRSLFVLAAIVLAAAGIYLQWQDSQHAKTLAAAILAADTASTDTTAQAQSLKTYVAGHMGTTTTYTLSGSYDRAAAASKASSDAEQSNQSVYAAAQAACMSHANSIVQAECNQAYLQSHLSELKTPTPIPPPKLADYQYTVKAPFWTPDLAGALMLGAIAALIVGLTIRRKVYR